MLQFSGESVILLNDEIRRIDGIIDKLEDFYRGPATRVLKRTFTEIFRGEGQTKSTQHWAPLAPSTVRARASRRRNRKKGQRFGSKILWDTGRLRSSYINTPAINIEGNTMRYGTDVPYAKYHETGTRFMPARPVVGYAAVIAPRRLQSALNKYIREEIDGG